MGLIFRMQMADIPLGELTKLDLRRAHSHLGYYGVLFPIALIGFLLLQMGYESSLLVMVSAIIFPLWNPESIFCHKSLQYDREHLHEVSKETELTSPHTRTQIHVTKNHRTRAAPSK